MYSIDYFKTFTLTVQIDTLQIFIAITVKKDLKLTYIDVKNVFTESPLKEEIYLAPLKGVRVNSGYILHVLQSLYSLKQVVRDWNLLY